MELTQKKVGFFKCRGLEDILHWTLVGIALYFSVTFYSDMLVGLLIAGVVFELMKPSLFQEGTHKKSLKGMAFLVLGSIFIFLSLLATCSALTNNYHSLLDGGTKKITTQAYTSKKQHENNIRAEIKNLKQQLDEYPTIEQFQNNIPSNHSTNLTKVTSDWQKGKQSIQDKLDNANRQLNTIIEEYTKIKQYEIVKVEGQYKSYTKLFELISKKINVNADYIAIFVFVLIAILIELGIVITKNLAVLARSKRLGTYQPSFEERLREYNNKILEYNFNNMMNQNNKTLYTAINQDTKIDQDRIYIPQVNNNQLPDKNINAIPNEEKKDLNSNQEKTDIPKPIDFKLNRNNEKSNVINLDKSKQPLDDKKTISTAKKKNTSRFESKELDINTIKKYFNYLLENSKDDVAIGYKKVANALNIRESEAQRIFNFLKENNYLKILDNKKSKIMNKDTSKIDEMLKKWQSEKSNNKVMEG